MPKGFISDLPQKEIERWTFYSFAKAAVKMRGSCKFKLSILKAEINRIERLK